MPQVDDDDDDNSEAEEELELLGGGDGAGEETADASAAASTKAKSVRMAVESTSGGAHAACLSRPMLEFRVWMSSRDWPAGKGR